MELRPENCRLYRAPHAFINKRGDAIVIRLLDEKLHAALEGMYLAYQPRNSIDGLPPLDDEVCQSWVRGMISHGLNLVALAMGQGLVGHAGLFAMDGETTEMLVVVAPSFQNIGIGTQLVRCSAFAARELGFGRIWLSVNRSNFRARHVYEKCGFVSDVAQDSGIPMTLDARQHEVLTSVTAGAVMTRHVITVSPGTSCRAALETMVNHRIGALPVIATHRELLGIISETDLLNPVNLNRNVGEIMTRAVTLVTEDAALDEVVSLFISRRVRCIPVVDDEGCLAGVIGRKDVLVHYLSLPVPPSL